MSNSGLPKVNFVDHHKSGFKFLFSLLVGLGLVGSGLGFILVALFSSQIFLLVAAFGLTLVIAGLGGLLYIHDRSRLFAAARNAKTPAKGVKAINPESAKKSAKPAPRSARQYMATGKAALDWMMDKRLDILMALSLTVIGFHFGLSHMWIVGTITSIAFVWYVLIPEHLELPQWFQTAIHVCGVLSAVNIVWWWIDSSDMWIGVKIVLLALISGWYILDFRHKDGLESDASGLEKLLVDADDKIADLEALRPNDVVVPTPEVNKKETDTLPFNPFRSKVDPDKKGGEDGGDSKPPIIARRPPFSVRPVAEEVPPNLSSTPQVMLVSPTPSPVVPPVGSVKDSPFAKVTVDGMPDIAELTRALAEKGINSLKDLSTNNKPKIIGALRACGVKSDFVRIATDMLRQADEILHPQPDDFVVILQAVGMTEEIQTMLREAGFDTFTEIASAEPPNLIAVLDGVGVEDRYVDAWPSIIKAYLADDKNELVRLLTGAIAPPVEGRKRTGLALELEYLTPRQFDALKAAGVITAQQLFDKPEEEVQQIFENAGLHPKRGHVGRLQTQAKFVTNNDQIGLLRYLDEIRDIYTR